MAADHPSWFPRGLVIVGLLGGTIGTAFVGFNGAGHMSLPVAVLVLVAGAMAGATIFMSSLGLAVWAASTVTKLRQ